MAGSDDFRQFLTENSELTSSLSAVERNPRTELIAAALSAALFVVALFLAPSLAGASDGDSRDAKGALRVPGEVLVGFRAGTESAARQRALDSAGAEQVDGIPGLANARKVDLESGQSIADALAELRSRDDVAWAQPNLIGHISGIPNDPEFGRLWAFDNTGQNVAGTVGTADADTDLTDAWDIATGAGAKIAVVDTGVDATNPDLADEVDQGLSRNFAPSIEAGTVDPSDWEDQNGHGTHVAGTIAAEGDNGIGIAGTSWDTDLIALRACDFDGYCDSADVASALAYAGSVGARAVNISIGFSGSSVDAGAIRSAISQYPDTIYVAAAGNEAKNVEQNQTWPCSFGLDNVICVAATDQDDRFAANFSNYGPVSVDLGAPGVNILSTVPNIVKKTDDSLSHGLAGWTGSPAGSWTLKPLSNDDPYIHLNVGGSATSATLTTDGLDFSGGRSCSSVYYLSAKLRIGQSLTEQISTDGGATWQSPGPVGSITATSDIDDNDFYEMSSWFGAADGAHDVLVRFSYSSTGASSQAPVIDIAYPLVSCIEDQPASGTYDVYSGTSMAAPQVTGAVALLTGYKPDLGADRVRKILLGSVDKLSSLSGRTVTGGRLNVAAALRDAANPQTGGDEDDIRG